MSDPINTLVASSLPAPVIIAADRAKLEAARTTAEVQLLSASLRVTDADSYAIADSLLAKIKTARKTIDSKFEPIIRPIRQGLDLIYALVRELDKPLGEAEASVKTRMAEWQLVERRRIEAEKREAEVERRRLAIEAQRKIEDQERAEREAESARRRAEELRGREKVQALAQAKAAEVRAAQAADETREIEEKQFVAQTAAQQKPVVAASSSSRFVEGWEVTDLNAFVGGVISGEVPVDMLMIDKTAVEAVWEVNRELVLSWPGVGKTEKMVIAGRAGRRV